MKLTINILLILLTLTSFGQTKKGKVYVAPIENAAGLQLKWVVKEIVYPEGVNIYRKGNDNNWQKLNSEPIQLIENLANSDFEDEASYKLYTVAETSYKDDLKNFVGAMLVVQSILDNQLAEKTGMYYQDPTAQVGENYTYKLMGIVNGQEEAITVSDPVIAAAYVKGKAPANIEMKRTKKAVLMTWLPELERYYAVKIYRKCGDAPYQLITKPVFVLQEPQDGKYAKYHYQDEKIHPDSNYTYKMVAVDYFTNESEESEPLAMPSENLELPTLPNALKMSVIDKTGLVKISWKNADDKNVKGYNIHFLKSYKDSVGEKMNPTLITAEKEGYNFTYQGELTNFYMVLEAVSEAGKSNFAAPILGTVYDFKPPTAPTDLTAIADTGFIQLHWIPSDSVADFMGYSIHRKIKGTTVDAPKVHLGFVQQPAYTDTLPKNVQTPFEYFVTAADTNFNYSEPSNVASAKMPDVEVPTQPLLLDVVFADTVVAIKWLANVDLDLKGYHLYRKSEKESEFNKVNFAAIGKASNSYFDRTAERGNKYEYYLVAEDESGLFSAASPSIKVNLPPAPNQALTPVNISLKYNKKKGVVLNWESKEKVNLLGFVVYKKIGNGSLKPINQLAMTLKYADKRVKAGTNYEYQIRSYDALGNVYKSELHPIKWDKKEK